MELVKLLLQIVQMGSGLLLILLVMLHSPKSDGVSSLGAMPQVFSSQKGAEVSLNRMTYTIVGVFYVASFILGYYLR